jgi:iron complex outermembrane receptor protein
MSFLYVSHRTTAAHRWAGMPLTASLLGFAMYVCALPAWAAEPPVTDLTELSLEQLMTIEVTSVSKNAQPLAQAAAAVFVISQEDIRRSGVRTIPEALRMAPGIQVARIDSRRWAVSSRGFNGEFSNKLLVLMDGRTVYTPLFSGVFWDVQDTGLEDIDRIEIIRGPGATLWGANAVNGVINIITKKAKDTQGLLVMAGAGTEERGFTALRYGGSLGTDTQFRIYGKYFDRDDFARSNGDRAADGWRNTRGGFRVDHDASTRDNVTIQGDYYSGSAGADFQEPLLAAPFSQNVLSKWAYAGGNLLSRWKHSFADGSSFVLQTYYDRTERESALFGERRDTIDLDAQHTFAWGTSQRVVWGLGYRFTNDQLVNTSTLQLTPYSRFVSTFSGFAQDEITIIPDTVAFIAGTKLEHNDYTGFVVQPSGRLRWTPTHNLTIWGAVSRGVRTPSRAEDDVRVNQRALPPNALFTGSPVALVSLLGNRGFQAETLAAYELGTRYQPIESLSIDIAAFYNRYDNLRSFEPGTPFVETSPSPVHLVVPLRTSNKLAAETHGIEASTDWRPLEWWRLQTSYTYLNIRMLTGSSLDPTRENANGESPQHQISVRSLMRLPGNLELDLWGRYTDRLPAIAIPGYFNLDVRLGWKPVKNVEISVVGQNLLDTRHPEFSSTTVPLNGSEIQRGAYVKVVWRY